MMDGVSNFLSKPPRACPHLKLSHSRQLMDNAKKLVESCQMQHAVKETKPVRIWACLTCYTHGCSRYSENKCMQRHYDEKGHPLATCLEDGDIWCYRCDVSCKAIYDSIDMETQNKLEKEFQTAFEGFKDAKFRILKSRIRGSTEPPRTEGVTASRRDSKGQGADSETSAVQKPLAKQGTIEVDSRRRLAPGSTAKDKIFGLDNLGNTCFFNSLTQVLLNSGPFIETLRRDVPNLSSNSLAAEILRLYDNAHPGSIASPKSLFAKLRSYKKVYSAYDQQDSHECFTHFLEILEKEYKDRVTPFRLPFFGYLTYSCFCSSCKNEEWVFEESASLFFNINAFEEGQMSPAVKESIREYLAAQASTAYRSGGALLAPINSKSIVDHKNVQRSGFDKSNDRLYVDLVRSGEEAPRKTEMEQLLYNAMTFKVHMSTESGFKCDKCKRSDRSPTYFGYNRTFVVSSPEILVIVLKRFRPGRWGMEKDSRRVSMNLEIDLSPYVLRHTKGKTEGPTPSPPVRYQLYGIIEQQGSIHGGHYVCYVKKESGNWYYVSDSRFSGVSESQVRELRSGYIYFYQRIPA